MAQQLTEAQREAKRQRYLRDAAKVKERAAQWAAANPERRREIQRAYRERDKAAKSQRAREIRELDPGRFRSNTLRHRHGKFIDQDWPAMWEAQGGCCYLCASPLDPDRAAVDHDHRCCPASSSCRACRRGLACHPCNKILGMADDDADRLRLMADNLEAALYDVEERMCAKQAQQIDLFSAGSTA
jgi:hypothetical protein